MPELSTNSVSPLTPRRFAYLTEHPALRECVNELALAEARYDNRRSAAVNAQPAAQPRRGIAANRLADYKNAVAGQRRRADPAELAMLENDVAAANGAIVALQDEATRNNALAGSFRAILTAALVFVDEAVAHNIDLKQVSTTVDGDPTKVLEAGLAKREALLARRKKTKASPLPAKDVEADLTAKLDKLAAEPTVKISFGGKAPQLNFSFSAIQLPNADYAAVSDLSGAYARHHRAEAVAEIRKQVAAHYAGVEIALSPDDKARAIRILNGEILAVERTLCAAAWALRGAGQDIAFPAGIDIRSVLGTDGPSPGERQARVAGGQ